MCNIMTGGAPSFNPNPLLADRDPTRAGRDVRNTIIQYEAR